MRLLLLSLVLITSSCVSTPRVNLNVFTVAVAGQQVLVGESISFGGRGSFELQSINGDPTTCTGRYTYRRLPKSKAKFNCTNGNKGTVKLVAGEGMSGTGKGMSASGQVQIAFGFSLPELNRQITFPSNTELVIVNNRYSLVPKDTSNDKS